MPYDTATSMHKIGYLLYCLYNKYGADIDVNSNRALIGCTYL